MVDVSKMTDDALVAYVQTTDQEAYREVMHRYQVRLSRYATSILQDESDAADVVQRAFIQAFVHLHRFRPSLKFSSWIYRIVHNEAMNVLTKRRRTVAWPEGMDVPSTEDVEEHLAIEEERRRVRFCLSRLPVLYAEPISLFFLEEKNYEEISDILRIPIGTVGTRIRRAKTYMKRICQTTP